jgi:ABC-type antimicrobial peptide transport system permease subunit
MIKHYLKVSFRNLWKYKYQTLVSVVGMAVGFACFAIATLWIRYEMTFDSFHKNADRLYCVSIKDNMGITADGLTQRINAPLALYLEKTFPEVRNATGTIGRNSEIEINDIKSQAHVRWIDSSFLKIFDIRIIEGNSDFLIHENRKIAITQEKARQLFGNKNPVGMTVKFDGEYTVGAVVTGYSKHSNFPFDVLVIYDPVMLTGNSMDIIVELEPKIDKKTFMKKLYEHKGVIERKDYSYNSDKNMTYTTLVDIEKITLSPLTSIHYKNRYSYDTMRFQHIIIFAIAGSLLILCTLFNYLTLFVCRFRIRSRELALRIVCGASNRSLFVLLSVEFIMSLIVALVFGAVLIQILIQPFRALSKVDIALSFIYFESLIYIGVIILVSLLMFLFVLYMFRRRALNIAIRRSNSKMFRKTSIVVQLIISIGFAFCSAIILKQMYFLRTTDLGFTFTDRAYISIMYPGVDATVIENQIRQIPEIEETVIGRSLINSSMYTNDTYDWDERPENTDPIYMDHVIASEKFAKFYKFQLVAGELINGNDTDEYVMINEAAAKVFGWKNPAGKRLNGKYIVKGIIKNICTKSFTEQVKPTIYMQRKTEPFGASILFKYKEGAWETCKEKVNQVIKTQYPDIVDNSIYVGKENIPYDILLYSENTLLKILTVISAVCLIICVFGFVSMVSLTCEERRKEIAIRKINGATIKDILDIFFKEHLTLLAIGALVAFPAGYLTMRRWLENYVIQTEMSAWIYVSILLALIMVIVLCVGGRVYKTSRENPIDSIQKL